MNNTRYIVAAGLLDGSGAAIRKNVYVQMQDGIITAVGNRTDLPQKSDLPIDDFSHSNILPALIDCSISLSCLPSVDKSAQEMYMNAADEEKETTFQRHVGYCFSHGVLGAIETDDSGPMVQRYLAAPHPTEKVDIRTYGQWLKNWKQEALGTITGGRPIRLCYSESIDSNPPSICHVSYAMLCDVIKKKEDAKVVVLANGSEKVAEALRAGCDAIEQGYDMGAENLKRMAERQVLWIPSVLRAKNMLDGSSSGGEVGCRFSQRYAMPGKIEQGAEAYWQKVLTGQIRQLKHARELKVPTAIGTGAGSLGILHGESMVEEMKLFAKAGYPIGEILRSASETAAAFFDMPQLGAIRVGKPATFLLVRGTAQQLPRKLFYLEGVYINGAPSSMYRKNPEKVVHSL